MGYRITGLDPSRFAHLFGMDDVRLGELGVVRMRDAPGCFCRVTLEDSGPGDDVLLLNFEHQPADTPFRASHAIFVREGDHALRDLAGPLPAQFHASLLSLRAFDAAGMMHDADAALGRDAEPVIARLLADQRTAYLHVHFARRGCYAFRVEAA